MNDIFSREQCINHGTSVSISAYLNNHFQLLNVMDLYHYTDISGFLSIIANQEFWLSNIQFMNDRLEYLEGKNRCKKIIGKMQHLYSEQEKELLETILKCLDDDFSAGIYSRSSKDVFSLSFSRNRDSLDMWRGYGNRSGIAIGFDMNQCFNSPGFAMMRKEQYEYELNNNGNHPEQMTAETERRLYARNIVYNEKVIDEIITEVIKIGLDHLSYKSKTSPDIAMISAVHCITDTLFDLFPFLKNSGFKNEEECRIIENYVTFNNNIPLKVYYRERNGIALPFIKYVLLDENCRPLKQWPISEIVIGPGLRQQDLAKSIKYFLNQQGMKDLANKVVLSSIPFVP
ncbi:DUF2971 domain-containing protein [Clostridium sp.]|jgi:hypothetical protein|uniref:DUF2971 domain-containing protein n=1 Tax=Clostridium sp. TaxID=1506 RepID=UPI00258A92C9|nr:DUF2971 domain-containing protein [Clostridium sp.]MDF2503056.1 hypothetical protein [Clostridium sp.]